MLVNFVGACGRCSVCGHACPSPPTPLFLDTVEFHIMLPSLRLHAILAAAILFQAFLPGSGHVYHVGLKLENVTGACWC